jgi:multidrug efflux pump subunit AcrB
MAKGGDIDLEGAGVPRGSSSDAAGGHRHGKVADQPRAVDFGQRIPARAGEALVIVLAVSFGLGLHTKPLRIDWRPGLVVLLTIPLVLAITFLSMWAFGINLHKISLGALIIALGLLVDDAIIAVEMMARKLEEGYDRAQAVTFMYESTAFPMLTGTLITAAGFLPIALAKSAAGEYTFSIFAVTAIALLISWFVAVLFVPLLGDWLLKKPPSAHREQELFDAPFYARFRRLVDGCVEWRKTVIAITLASLALGIVGFRFIEQQFFPDSNRLELVVNLWLPEGSSIAATEEETKKFESWLGAQPELDYYVSYVGTGAPRFYLPLDQQFNNTNLAEIIVAKSLAGANALRTGLSNCSATTSRTCAGA